MSAADGTACPLCGEPGGTLVWRSRLCRVIEVDDPDYPGFFRVVLNRHCAEMSDLPPADRGALMEVVWAVEETLRQKVCPDKINLASLGNVVPHLHWHVIPRWHDDRHFPNPVWGAEQRVTKPRRLDRDGLRAALQRRLAVFA